MMIGLQTWSIGSRITARLCWKSEKGREALSMRGKVLIEFTMRICGAPMRNAKT